MTIPNISTTISEGYKNGIDLLTRSTASLAVPALILGLISAFIAQIQGSLTQGTIESLLKNPAHTNNMMLLLALSALSSVIQLFFFYSSTAVFGGFLYRERNQDTNEENSSLTPASILGEMFQAASQLAPKLSVLVVVMIVMILGGLVPILKFILPLLAMIVMIYLGVRWVYASIILGSKQAEGSAAFDLSENAVSGNFWGTFGVFLVVGLATFIPLAIISQIIARVLPGAFLSSFSSLFISTLGSIALTSAVLESAWHQVNSE